MKKFLTWSLIFIFLFAEAALLLSLTKGADSALVEPEEQIEAEPTPEPEPTADPRETAYEEAVRHMYRREYVEALSKFDYADMHEQSKVYEGYCRLRLGEDFSAYDPIICEDNILDTFENGVMYRYDPVYAYVPNEITEDTRFSVYFAGGTGGFLLFVDGVYEYIRAYSPDAVMLFNTNSGTQDIPRSINTMIRISNQIAAECGISIHDLAISGSSNGCYTAVHAAAAFYTDNSVAARSVLTYDTGKEWNLTHYNMSQEEMEATAGTGIRYYLFEQPEIDLGTKAIYDLVATGNEVYAVYCTHDDHDRMSRLAYTNGLFSWGMGEFDELDEDEYKICLLALNEQGRVESKNA